MRAGRDSINRRARLMMQAGMTPGPEGSLNKLIAVRSRQKLSELALDLQGTDAFAFDEHASSKDDWASSWINAPTGRIAGGSDEPLLHSSEEHTSELPSLMRISYAVFCLKKTPSNKLPH